MKKRIFGRRLQRDTNERTALFKGLMSSLVLFERIQTTQAKAKAIKGQIEKLVTQIKKKRDPKNNHLETYLSSPAIQKLVEDIAPRFALRPGGYTRIIKVRNRFSDNASMVLMEWVEGPGVKSEKLKVKSSELKDKKEQKTNKKTLISKQKTLPRKTQTRKSTDKSK